MFITKKSAKLITRQGSRNIQLEIQVEELKKRLVNELEEFGQVLGLIQSAHEGGVTSLKSKQLTEQIIHNKMNDITSKLIELDSSLKQSSSNK